jgi:hypothetical protein
MPKKKKKAKAGRTRLKSIKPQARRVITRKKTTKRRRNWNPEALFFDQQGRLVIADPELASWLHENLEDKLEILSVPIKSPPPVPPITQCPDLMCDCNSKVRWRFRSVAELRGLEPLRR